MNKYSNFSKPPITPSTKLVTSVPYADAKPGVAAKKEEPLPADPRQSPPAATDTPASDTPKS